jgi:hypothetical protein
MLFSILFEVESKVFRSLTFDPSTLNLSTKTMPIYSQKPLTLSKVNTYPIASRPSKVTLRDFAKADC